MMDDAIMYKHRVSEEKEEDLETEQTASCLCQKSNKHGELSHYPQETVI